MGWLDAIWRKRWQPPSDAPPLVRVTAPDSLTEHEALVRGIAALAKLELDVAASSQNHRVRVTISRGPRQRAVSHPPHAVDLPRLTAALDAFLPDDDRHFWGLTHANEDDALVAYGSELELRPLLAQGWRATTIDKEPDAPASGDPIPLRPGHQVWPDGTLKEGTLAAPFTLDGIPCAAGTVVRFVEGFLVEATLAAPVPLIELTLPAGSRVFLHRRSSRIGVARLADELEIGGRKLPIDTEVHLDRAGHLVAAVLELEGHELAGYRERPRSHSQATVPFRDGRWQLAEAQEPRPNRPR